MGTRLPRRNRSISIRCAVLPEVSAVYCQVLVTALAPLVRRGEDLDGSDEATFRDVADFDAVLRDGAGHHRRQ